MLSANNFENNQQMLRGRIFEIDRCLSKALTVIIITTIILTQKLEKADSIYIKSVKKLIQVATRR